jgi:hypothetical protein
MKKEISFKEFLKSKETKEGKWLCVYNLKEEFIYKFFYGKRSYFMLLLPLGAPCSLDSDDFIHNHNFNTVYRVKEAYNTDDTYIGFQFDYVLPLLDLNTGKLAVVYSWQYDLMISKGIEILELNAEEHEYAFNRVNNVASLDIEHAFNNNPLMFMSIYKREAPAEDAKPNGTVYISSNMVGTDVLPEIKMVDGSIDLEYYYHNWKKITDYEQKEVLKWLAVNDYGFRIALISKQYY